MQRQPGLQRAAAGAAHHFPKQMACRASRVQVVCWAHGESQRPTAPPARLPPSTSMQQRQRGDNATVASPSVPLPMRRLAQSLIIRTLAFTSPRLKGMAPRHALLLLDACVAAGCQPERHWLDQLYAAWPLHDAAAPSMLPHTLHLLEVLGKAGVQPPAPFLEKLYYAVGARCSSDIQVRDVVQFLRAASAFSHSHPLDRDLMLSLTSALLLNGAAHLSSASQQDVAQLLPSIVAAGHAPGMPLTAAVLQRLQPHLGGPTPSTPSPTPGSSDPQEQQQRSASQHDNAAAASEHASAPPAPCLSAYHASAPSPSDLLPLPTLLAILEAAVGPATGTQLPTPLEPPSAAASIAARLQESLLSLPPADAVRALAAMAFCRLPPCPETLVRNALAALAPSLSDLQPCQLSALIVALQRLGVAPDQDWIEVYHAALCASLDRFHDSDALIEALDALTAMDRQLGFRALNQLAHSAAASIRAPSSGARVSLAGTSGSGGSSSAGGSGGVAGSAAGAGQAAAVAGWCNTLLLLSYLNHNPGYEPVQAIAGALQPYLSNLTGQQLTNVLWSLARLKRTPCQSSWLDQAKEAASQQLRGGYLKPYQMAFVFGSLQSLGASLDSAWVDEMLDCVRAQLPAMPSHDVALVLHTVSRLQHVTSYAWMADVESHVSMRLEAYQPNEITTVLYAMAKLHHRPPSEWLQAVEDAFLDQLPSFSPDNQVTLLSALLDLGHTPGTVFLDALCAACQPQLLTLRSPELVALLTRLGKLKYQPETEWLASFLSVLHYHLPLLEASSFASVVHSLSLMEAQVSSDEWWSIFCHTMRPRLAAMKKEDLLTMVVALPVCGLRHPPAQWSKALAERVVALACDGSLTPDEAERLVVALGACSVQPPPQLLDDFLGASLPRLGSLPPTRITRLVDSFCRGGVMPSRGYLEGLVTAARASVYSFTLLELAQLTQGLTQLNSRSPQPVPAVSDFLALVKEWL